MKLLSLLLTILFTTCPVNAQFASPDEVDQSRQSLRDIALKQLEDKIRPELYQSDPAIQKAILLDEYQFYDQYSYDNCVLKRLVKDLEKCGWNCFTHQVSDNDGGYKLYLYVGPNKVNQVQGQIVK